MTPRRLSPFFALLALTGCGSAAVPDPDPAPVPAPPPQAFPALPPTPIQCSSAAGPILPPGPVDASAWYGHITGALDQESMAIAVDSHGNVIVTGHAVGATDFGAGPVAAIGDQDLFVAKLDPAGKLLWAHRFGGGVLEPTDVAIDSQDRVLVTGSHGGAAADLGGPSLGATADAVAPDIFVFALSAGGNSLWAATRGVGGALNQPGKIAVGPDDRVVIAASIAVSSAGESLFLAGLSAEGSPLFQRSIGQIEPRAMFAPVDAVRLDGHGDIFVIGTSSGKTDLGTGAFDSPGNEEVAFVAKYDGALGAPLWSKHWDGGDGENPFADGQGLLVLGDDVVIASGGVPEVNLGGGGALSTCGASSFVARLSGQDGAERWVRSIGGARATNERLSLGPDSRVELTINLDEHADLGGGEVASPGTFAAAYDAATGAFVRARQIVEIGTMSASTENGFWGLGATASDGKGHLFVESSFFETQGYGLGKITSQGWGDVLVVRTAF